MTGARRAWEAQGVVGGKGGEFACAHSLLPLRSSQLFRCQGVLKDHKAHREPPDRLAHKGPPGQRARKDRPGHKERRVRPEPLVLPACPARREPAAVSVRRDHRGPEGPAGPAGTAGLHALTETACDTKCELLCSAGEKLVSVTCPGGTIWIGRTAESETATCSNSPGPALALCVKR